MNKTIVIFSVVLSAGCHAQTQNTPATAPPPAQTQVEAPPVEDLAAMKWKLREAVKMQLPVTFPEKRGDEVFGKNYSFDIEDGADGKPVWVIPEKRLDKDDKVYSGGRYYLPFSNIDQSSFARQISADSTRQSLVIRAKPGMNFLYHPFGNEPDQTIQTVELGLWDRVQDRTLERVLDYFRKTAAAMPKESGQ